MPGAKHVTRVALLGLGRTGRDLFRLLHDQGDLELTAVSDPADPGALANLLRLDTERGRFPGKLSLEGGPAGAAVAAAGGGAGPNGAGGSAVSLVAAGRRVRVLAGRPGEPSWGELGVDTVLDTGRQPRQRGELERHLQAGARRVLTFAAAESAADIVAVAGVNDGALAAPHRIVSPASPAAGAAGPVLATLAEAFGVERAFVNVVHAYTEEEHLADVPAPHLREGRAAAANIIPLGSSVAGPLAELLPALRGRLTAGGMSVPVANGSVVDLVCWHRRAVTIEEVNGRLREAAESPALQGILAYEVEPIVSSDVRRSAASGTLDSLATMVLGGKVSKTLIWFDNSWGQAHRAIDLLRRFQELDEQAAAGAGAQGDRAAVHQGEAAAPLRPRGGEAKELAR